MSGLKFSAFAGVIPRVSDRLIDQRNAARADNLKAFSGELRAWRRPLRQVAATKTGGTVKSIFRETSGAAEYFYNWLTDVDVVRGPLAGDTSKRIYYTGDNAPKKTNLALATSGTDYPYNHYEMGIPVPAACTAAVSVAGAGTTSNRTYLVTFVNGWDEEGPPSAVSGVVNFGATGFTIALTGIDTGTRACTITRVGSVATVALTAHGIRDQSRMTVAGATEPEYNVTATATYIDADHFSFVVAGAPATPATGAPTVTGNYNLTKRRIYRSLVGSNGITAWQLVTELANVTATTYNDSILDASLGVVCPSFDPLVTGSSWLEPPEDMVGLIDLPGEGMAGFYGNVLCLCEPGYPHGWPLRYQQTFPTPIVGIKAFGSTIVVATEGVPYNVTGTHPENMSAAKVEDWKEPCLSKRGMADGPDGIYYPSPNGIVQGGLSGFSNITEAYFTGGVSGEWAAQVYPSTLIGVIYDGRYMGFFSTDTDQGMGVILPKRGDAPGVLFHTQYVTAAWVDPSNSRLYVVQDNIINLWDGDENNLIPFDWWSKVMTLPEPVNFGCWLVEADYSALDVTDSVAAAAAADLAFNITVFTSGITDGELNAAELNGYDLNGSLLRGGSSASFDGRYLQFEAYAENEDSEMVLQLSTTVTSKDMDRLPSNIESDVWQFRLTGNIPAKTLKVAEVPKDLRAL